jgi:hypothetical protein
MAKEITGETVKKTKSAAPKAPRKTAANAEVAEVKAVLAPVEAPVVAAPAPKAVKKAPAKKAAAPAAAVTTVVAKIDVGFGNSLYIRGASAGLSWDVGTVMENTASDEWVWTSTKAEGTFSVKVLINDNLWSEGEDIIVVAGQKTVINPLF